MRASARVGMVLALCSACSVAWARPVIYEEKVKLTSPDPAFNLTRHVAVDGNDLLVMAAAKEIPLQGDYHVVFHFERQANGAWVSRGKVDGLQFQDVGVGYSDLALVGGIAVFSAEHRGVHILERTATGWTITDIGANHELIPGDLTSEVRVVGTTVALAARNSLCTIYLLRKNAQGAWSRVDQIVSPDETCLEGDFDNLGPAGMEYSGSQALIHHTSTYLYDLINGAWRATQLPAWPNPVVIGTEIARRAGAARERGDVLYLERRNATGQWTVRDTFRSEESYANVAPGIVIVRGTRAVTGAPNNDIRGENSGSLNVYTRDSSGRFNHVATLLSTDGTRLGGGGRTSVSSNGQTIATSAADSSGQQAVYLYELPATIPGSTRVQDTFQDANAAGWTPFGATSWSVVQSSGSYVYRQTNVQGDARSVLDSPITGNQSIEADVRLRTFGTTSWAGLMVRQSDALNFYYLMINNDKTIQIRKIVNGSFGPLVTAPFTPVVGRTYRVRLEAVGTDLRAYVDGNLMLQARDSSHKRGKAGVIMWKTAADYDNVIVSTSHAVELLQDTFAQTEEEQLTPWTTSPAGAWTHVTSSGATVFQQSQLNVMARAVNGAPARDQIVSADIRPLAFYATGIPFAGLMARYVNDSNYYYVLLNKNNTVSLRKLTNGVITVLDEAPMTIQPGTSYRVRLEAIGTSLRLYVNGNLMAEAVDSTFPSGRYGLATYRTTAQYDNFRAVRP